MQASSKDSIQINDRMRRFVLPDYLLIAGVNQVPETLLPVPWDLTVLPVPLLPSLGLRPTAAYTYLHV